LQKQVLKHLKHSFILLYLYYLHYIKFFQTHKIPLTTKIKKILLLEVTVGFSKYSLNDLFKQYTQVSFQTNLWLITLQDLKEM